MDCMQKSQSSVGSQSLLESHSQSLFLVRFLLIVSTLPLMAKEDFCKFSRPKVFHVPHQDRLELCAFRNIPSITLFVHSTSCEHSLGRASFIGYYVHHERQVEECIVDPAHPTASDLDRTRAKVQPLCWANVHLKIPSAADLWGKRIKAEDDGAVWGSWESKVV